MKRRITPDKLLGELEDVAGRLFSEIRYEQGQFQTGTCILKGKRFFFEFVEGKFFVFTIVIGSTGKGINKLVTTFGSRRCTP